jgi:hypothetical protein
MKNANYLTIFFVDGDINCFSLSFATRFLLPQRRKVRKMHKEQMKEKEAQSIYTCILFLLSDTLSLSVFGAIKNKKYD